MIGGYIFDIVDRGVELKLQRCLNSNFNQIKVWNNGYVFYDEPFGEDETSFVVSNDIIALSQQPQYPQNILIRQIFPVLHHIITEHCGELIMRQYQGQR